MTSKHRAARTTSRPASNAMIALESVELTLPSAAGPVHILRGLDLIVEPGETVSVVGPSGSGKSSMMMIIAGLERASKGEVHVGGTRRSEEHTSELQSLMRISYAVFCLKKKKNI